MILYLPGFLCNEQIWNDMPHGHNANYNTPYEKTLSGIAKHIVSTAPSLVFNTIVAYSMGGYVCLELLKHNMLSAKKLILVSTSYKRTTSNQDAFLQRYNEDNQHTYRTNPDYIQHACYQKVAINKLQEIVNMNNAVASKELCTQATALHPVIDYTETIQKLNMDVSIITGENDKVVPHIRSLEMHQLISQSKLYKIEQCGHIPQIEHPAQLKSILQQAIFI